MADRVKPKQDLSLLTACCSARGIFIHEPKKRETSLNKLAGVLLGGGG